MVGDVWYSNLTRPNFRGYTLEDLFQSDENVGGTLDTVSTLLQYWLKLTPNTLVSKVVVTSLSISGFPNLGYMYP